MDVLEWATSEGKGSHPTRRPCLALPTARRSSEHLDVNVNHTLTTTITHKYHHAPVRCLHLPQTRIHTELQPWIR